MRRFGKQWRHYFRSMISTTKRVLDALGQNGLVVALESTVISHGLPGPDNIETAVECEDVITAEGATAATIGIVAGVPTIGLSREELRVFAEGQAPDGSSIEKVSLNNLGIVAACKGWGATTVAGSIWIATLGGRAFDGAKRPLVFSATSGLYRRYHLRHESAPRRPLSSGRYPIRFAVTEHSMRPD